MWLGVINRYSWRGGFLCGYKNDFFIPKRASNKTTHQTKPKYRLVPHRKFIS
jgi:hypothetical protein